MARSIKYTAMVSLGIVVGLVIWFATNSTNDDFQNIESASWPLLAQLDAQNSFIPDVLKELERNEIKLAGFVVPLTDNFKEIKEFLLVPDSMSCIHVPPPPSNQMVLVSLEKEMNPQFAYGPVWVKGRLEIRNRRSEFGSVSYSMKANRVKVFEEKSFR